MKIEQNIVTLGGSVRDGSANLLAQGLNVIPGGMTRLPARQFREPIYYESGRGAIVTDVDGYNYIDFVNNYTSLIHGHAYSPILEALRKQLKKGISFSGPTRSEIDLARILVERNSSFGGVRFMNSGTEAVMYALKAARAITGRSKIAKIEGAFHGAYDPVQISFDPKPENWGNVDAPDPVLYCRGTPTEDASRTVVLPFNNIASTRAILKEHKDTLAAVLIDPVPQSVGLIPIARDYLEFLREFTAANNILLIVDEIMSFRLSPAGGLSLYGLEADLWALGKVIGGGMPIGAVAGPRSFMSVFDASHAKPSVPQSGTFAGNPMSMVAGIAALEGFNSSECARLNALGERARLVITDLFGRRGWPYSVSGMGSMFRLHLRQMTPRNYREAYLDQGRRSELAQLIHLLMTYGLVVTPTCQFCLSTPMNEDYIDEMAVIVERSFDALHRQ